MGRKRNRGYILPEGVYQHGRRFRMRIYFGDDRRPGWHSFKASTVEQLYREYGRYMRRQGLTTMNDLFTRYEAQEIPRKAPASQASDQAALRQLRPVFGTMRPQAIRRQHVVSYLDNRGAVAPVRANRERSLLSHVLTKATHWGILDENPILGLQYRNPEEPRSRYVTDAELRAAYRLAPEVIRHVMRLAHITGLRRKDILGLRWGDLDQEGLTVSISKSKRAGAAVKQLKFLWSKALRRVFERAGWGEFWSGDQSHLVYPISEATFARLWTEFQNRLETTGIERFQLKDLRAKHATDALAKGQDATARLAHSSAATTRRHYTQRLPTKVKL